MKDAKTYATAGVGLLIGAGAGAGLMYLFDPNRGRARRAELESRAKRLYREAGRTIDSLAKDMENRCEGMAAEAKHFLDQEPVDNTKLTARVRAKLGRLVRHPHEITVEAEAGKITLTGEIDAALAGRLLTGVMAVPGVKDVENKLLLRHPETGEIGRGAGAIASMAGGLIAFAGIRAMKRAG
jgi:osmotically-inducible protein OsmY